MTPARNNVRATRHFGIPARKSSPNNSPILAKPRKNSPSTPLQPFPREKTRPTTAQSWPNREKTRPARPKTPKSSHFSRAGRTFSRFQRRTTEQGDFSPATTPLNTHHRDTTTQPPPQPVEKSPCNTCHKAQPVQNSPSTPTINENWPFLASKENYFPFPTPHHRAGRIFSRNNTTQHPSQGHHHPTTTPTGTKLSLQHPPQGQPVQNSPHNTHLKAQPVQNSPGTPKNNENWPFLASRENLFPFPTRRHRAGRIFSRNNTILVSLSTQLTGWSPLSPGTRPIHPSAGHCAGYWLLIMMQLPNAQRLVGG